MMESIICILLIERNERVGVLILVSYELLSIVEQFVSFGIELSALPHVFFPGFEFCEFFTFLLWHCETPLRFMDEC